MTTQIESLRSRVDDIYPGLTCEWLYNNRVVVYHISQVTNGVIENWSRTVLRLLEHWPKHTTYLAVHDVSAPGVSLQYASLVGYDLMNIGITLKGRELAEDYFNHHPGFHARVAISFNLSVSGQVSHVIMDRLRAKHPAIQYKTYFNRETSLNWLREHISEQAAASATD